MGQVFFRQKHFTSLPTAASSHSFPVTCGSRPEACESPKKREPSRELSIRRCWSGSAGPASIDSRRSQAEWGWGHGFARRRPALRLGDAQLRLAADHHRVAPTGWTVNPKRSTVDAQPVCTTAQVHRHHGLQPPTVALSKPGAGGAPGGDLGRAWPCRSGLFHQGWSHSDRASSMPATIIQSCWNRTRSASACRATSRHVHRTARPGALASARNWCLIVILQVL